MNIKDQFFIIRKRLFEKRNIILIIVLTIIFLILFSCLTIMQFSVENKKAVLNSVDERTYKISPEMVDDKVNHRTEYIDFTEEQLEKIRNINHVELVESEKYLREYREEVSEFNNGNEQGIILLKALLKEDDIKIKKGKGIQNKYELVCSNTFYPHEYDERIYSNFFLSNKDILNKQIKVISDNEDLNKKEISLTIVGTYENKFEEAANTCYTNIETFDEIVHKYNGYNAGYDEDGNLINKEYSEYSDYLVRIDSRENINEVLKALNDMGIEYRQCFYTNLEFFTLLYSIPLFVAIIVILLTLLILYNFISKKNMNRLNYIGMLKAVGYDEKAITTLNINENIVVTAISCVISLIIYLITLNYLTYTLLAEITYTSLILNVPYILIFLSFIIFVFIVSLIVKSNFKKIFKFSVFEQLTK